MGEPEWIELFRNLIIEFMEDVTKCVGEDHIESVISFDGSIDLNKVLNNERKFSE
jgi:hypothetical protein